jgi:murein L,D-transpeptidase YafK
MPPALYAKPAESSSASAKASNKAKNKSKSKQRQSSKESSTPRPNPDALLSGIYMDLAVGQLRPAMAKADQLVEAYPNFRLAHLVRGDLLMMHARPVTTFGAVPNGAPETKLQELRAEAMARLKVLHQKPDPDLIPRAFTQLREDHKYVVLIDTKQSRLFVYMNRNGKFSLLNHYYVSQGKLGINKASEGDQKTPIGIYRITSRIAREKLPDFYGSGALPLNYPNDWDRVNDRGGSGIWLHGMPSESFSRPPLASDGCVALTNPDLAELASTLDIYKTLVVISDRVEMVNAKIWHNDRKAANIMLEKWRRDMEYGNRNYLLKHYSDKFKSSANEDLKTWFEKQYPANANTNTSLKIRDVSLMRYPGHPNMIAAAFKLDIQSGKITSQTRRYQLWAKEGKNWKIVYENTIKDFL